jgi:hypothetical protein
MTLMGLKRRAIVERVAGYLVFLLSFYLRLFVYTKKDFGMLIFFGVFCVGILLVEHADKLSQQGQNKR